MSQALWNRFKQYYFHDEELGISLDISRMKFSDEFFTTMAGPMQEAYNAMALLEAGEIANPDENRMVGHYWLRNAAKAPGKGLQEEIAATLAKVEAFTAKVHAGQITGEKGQAFSHLLVVGIGGSALGPQLVADALGTAADRLKPHFCDNTDPDGLQRTLTGLKDVLDGTIVLVISKSGGTPETANGMITVQTAYEAAGIDFAKHAVAVTGEGSKLDKIAVAGGWIERFPMWDWVGGRTSVMAVVGLLPAALQGVDIGAMLAGAAAMDRLTRNQNTPDNPAALLALMWHHAGGGRGAKDMVILPYKDRLLLMSKYLQQLVMESLGKELDLKGNVVNQGLAVYGNKGSTDQHAYVQQLREGLNNFFATFIEVLDDDAGSLGGAKPPEIEPGVTAGDYLEGFLIGTRTALYEKDRESMTLTIRELNAQSLGMIVALYERAVGLYAALVGINAYHQPGVEAGKKAAQVVLDLQVKLTAAIAGAGGAAKTAEQWAGAIGEPEAVETVFKLLERLAANGRVRRTAGAEIGENTYGA